jgi:hypothetical protein
MGKLTLNTMIYSKDFTGLAYSVKQAYRTLGSCFKVFLVIFH